MSVIFNPKSLALKVISDNSEKDSKNYSSQFKKSGEVAETQKFLWISDGKSNMGIPIDGWNSIHWHRYFSMHFRNIFGHMYTGKTKTDMLCMGSFLFRAQRELGMGGTEIKQCFDWIAKNKMPMIKAQGKIYFIAMLKDDLNDFYNAKIYALKYSDEKNQTKNRDLFIDARDFRESLKNFMQYDEKGKVIGFDVRILIQLGIPVILEYLTVQECMSDKEAKDLVLNTIEKIINQDIIKNNIGTPMSPKFERILKNSLDWEPYPWKDFNWRKMIEKAIIYFDIENKDWWRKEPPIANIKPANCLKILKSKKRR